MGTGKVAIFTEITSTELTEHTAKYVKLVLSGESFLITSHGKTVAQLVPPETEEVTLPKVDWEASPSAGTAGSPVAADGRRHFRDFPCPSGLRYRLSDDKRMWLLDYPPVNLKTAERVLGRAFPQRRR